MVAESIPATALFSTPGGGGSARRGCLAGGASPHIATTTVVALDIVLRPPRSMWRLAQIRRPAAAQLRSSVQGSSFTPTTGTRSSSMPAAGHCPSSSAGVAAHHTPASPRRAREDDRGARGCRHQIWPVWGGRRSRQARAEGLDVR
ncbi:unnamed protein product [Urochloa humidicola]